MSATLTMWLGIAFVLLAIAAVVLQAWLWSFPFDKKTRKSAAPRSWILVHRAIGYAYGIIYVIMMVEMVPRLWEYQVELPARTVMHACLGITIGVLLVVKLSILRFFRHFEEAMPKLAMGLLVCTIVMGVLSIPYALRAHAYAGGAFEEQNRARTREIVAGLDFGHTVDADALTTTRALGRGQEILTSKCATCHDLRTVLIKPRSGVGWLDTVQRMAAKPTLGRPLSDDDIAFVTAYLVAITPDLQEAASRKKADQKKQQETVAQMNAATGAPTPTEPSAPPPPPFDPAQVKPVFEAECSQCHKLEKVEKHGTDTEDGWREVVKSMIEENDAELDAKTATAIIQYLATTRGKQ